MSLRMRQEEKDPSREDQIVGAAGQRGLGQRRVPDGAVSESVPRSELAKPPTEYRGRLDHVDRAAHPSSQLDVKRALARADLEHPPASPDAESIEERECCGIPKTCLRSQTRCLASRISEQVSIGLCRSNRHQQSVRQRTRPL